jgi:hypothetical protein
MTTNALTDLQIANLATRVAYMTDPVAIKAATDGQWVYVDSANRASGYQGTLVYNASTNTYALLNAGTNDWTDALTADKDLFFRNIARAQLDDAVDFADRMRKDIANGDHKDASFLIGGHSLGDWLSKALVALDFGSAPAGQPVNFGIDGPGLTPFDTPMQAYADEKGMTYDFSRVFSGRYIVSADSPISFGMTDPRYQNIRTDAILTTLEHEGWGYQAVAYIRTELELASYGDVHTRNLTQNEGEQLGVPASAFELNPRVTGFFDGQGQLVAYAQIGANGNQVDSNTIQFFGMNGFASFGKITSGANEQLTCSISQKTGNVTTTQIDDSCNLSIQDSGKVIDNGDGTSRTQMDLGNDGIIESDTVVLDGKTYDLSDPMQMHALEGAARGDGLLGNTASQSGFWEDITQSIADFFVSAGSQPVTQPYDVGASSPYLEPIGAFYDSQSKSYDEALSIADKTGVLVDSQGRRVSLATVQGLDANHDGVLSITEAASLKLLTDRNENGRLESGELNSVTSARNDNFYAEAQRLAA